MQTFALYLIAFLLFLATVALFWIGYILHDIADDTRRLANWPPT